jgi:outer membrane immunogenic protein
MFKSLLAGTALVILPLAASAADLPHRATAPVLAQAPFSWNGMYVGASIGAVGLGTTVKGYYSYDAGSDGYDTKGNGGGALAGASIGYNYQMNNIVFGLEADVSGAMASVEKTETGTHGYGEGYISNTSSKLNGLGTIRARLGVAFDRTLVFATAGVAFGSFTHKYANDEGTDASYGRNFGSSVRTGWVVGAGVEQALTNSVSLKLEALYADFGTKKYTNQFSAPCGPYTCSDSVEFVHFKDSALVVRTGVNFRF